MNLFVSQLPKVEMIVFNNGLHSWHLEDSEEHGAYYEDMIKYLLEKFCNVPIFIALTTFVKDEERHRRVVARNRAAGKITEKYGLPIIDLYSVTEKNKNFLCPDGVQFVKDGYEIIAKTILDVISK